MPNYTARNFEERGFTVGIGGYVLLSQACLVLVARKCTYAPYRKTRWFWEDRAHAGAVPEVAEGVQHRYVIPPRSCVPTRCRPLAATVTNDIFTKEDQEFLIKNKALPSERILAIETGGCPHAAIREDISANMGALETLQAKYGCQLLFVESGGDNLAANYSRELADYIIYVIDVSVCVRCAVHICVGLRGHMQGGDKIPRKGGPGISQSDLLVINKVSNLCSLKSRV